MDKPKTMKDVISEIHSSRKAYRTKTTPSSVKMEAIVKKSPKFKTSDSDLEAPKVFVDIPTNPE